MTQNKKSEYFRSTTIFRLCLCLLLIPLLITQMIAPSPAHDLIENQLQGVFEAIDNNPHDANLYVTRGLLYREHRQFDKALESFLLAHDLDPNLDSVDFQIGRLYQEYGHPDRALPHLDKYIKQHPGHISARSGMKLRGRGYARVSPFSRSWATVSMRPGR